MVNARLLEEVATNIDKLERFEGINFKRWQMNLRILLMQLGVVHVLMTPKPEKKDNETIAETRNRLKWEQDDFSAKGFICNSLPDLLFDIYYEKSTAKEVWDTLEQRYVMDDSTRKFIRYKNNGDSTKRKRTRRGNCYYCQNLDHYVKECSKLRADQKKKGKSVADNYDNQQDHFVAVISGVNLHESDQAWYVSSVATRHVCKDRSLFREYEPESCGNVLYLGDGSTVAVKGKGKIHLNFTSGKTLILNDVYHVPDISRNLVSVGLLSKHGFKLVFESDKVVLTKGGAFVGKGHVLDGMFKFECNTC